MCEVWEVWEVREAKRKRRLEGQTSCRNDCRIQCDCSILPLIDFALVLFLNSPHAFPGVTLED